MNRDFGPTLRKLNLKATPKRLAILAILTEELVYLSPEEVWQRMRTRFERIGLPTVYRNLEDLARGGIIIQIIHPSRKLYYYYCPNAHHHHHFVCVTCRKVEDLNFCGAREIEEEVEKGLEGEVTHHLLQVYGYCKGCKGAG